MPNRPKDPDDRLPVSQALEEHGATISGTPEAKEALKDLHDDTGPHEQGDPSLEDELQGALADHDRPVPPAQPDESPVAGESSEPTDEVTPLIGRLEVPEKYARYSHQELVDELRGWASAQFTGDHPLATDQLRDTDDILRQYLAYLNAHAEQGLSVDEFPPLTIGEFVESQYTIDSKSMWGFETESEE